MGAAAKRYTPARGRSERGRRHRRRYHDPDAPLRAEVRASIIDLVATGIPVHEAARQVGVAPQAVEGARRVLPGFHRTLTQAEASLVCRYPQRSPAAGWRGGCRCPRCREGHLLQDGRDRDKPRPTPLGLIESAYLAGEPVQVIAERYGTTITNVYTRASAAGLKRTPITQRWNPQLVARVAADYQAGVPTDDIMARHGLTSRYGLYKQMSIHGIRRP